MNLKINKEQFKLKSKSEQVLCQQHKKPILFLNIEQNQLQGGRICCEQCPSVGQRVLFLGTAEEYIFEWYQQENIEIENQKAQFNSLINVLLKTLQQKEQEFMKLLKREYEKVTQLCQEYTKYIEVISKTKLYDYVFQFSQNEPINQHILTNLADYFSQQKISQNSIERVSKLDFYEAIHEGIYPQILKTLDSINQLQVKNFQDVLFAEQQQYFKSFASQDNNLKQYFKYKNSKQMTGHSNNIGAVAISKDDLHVASGDGNGLIILWEIAGMKQVTTYHGDNNGISDLAFSQEYLAVAQFPFKFKSFLKKSFCDILLFKYRDRCSFSQIRLQSPQNCSINKILFIENQNVLLSAGNNKNLSVWNIEEQQCIQTIALSNSVNGLAVSVNGDFAAGCCTDGKVYLYNTPKYVNMSIWNELVSWNAHVDSVYSIMFSPDSKNIITSSQQIRVWSIEVLMSQNYKSWSIQISCENYASCLTFNLNNNIAMYNDGMIKFWKMDKEESFQQLYVEGGYSQHNDKKFVVTQDMKYIITGGSDQKLKVYEQDLS